MTTLPTEFRRDGRPLTDWLHDLVADRPAVRRAAAAALQAMWQGLPERRTIHDDLAPEVLVGMDGADRRFADAVRAAVAAQGFPTAEYADRLCGLLIAMKADWLDRCDRAAARRERTSALLDRSTAKMTPATAVARIMRVACAEFASEDPDYTTAEAMSEVNLMGHVMLDALGPALLASADALGALIDYRPERYYAYRALTRIGPPAVRYASTLLERLDRGADNDRREIPPALGSIGRNDPATVAAVLARLDSPDADLRTAAIATLGHMAPDLAGRNDEVIQRLLTASDDPATGFCAVDPVAAVGPTDPRVVDRVIEMMARRPPVIQVVKSYSYHHEWDRTMVERGSAIVAAARLTAFPDRVVPALVAAFDSFVEYDCDVGYGGDHARVCQSLIAFGPAAAPAVPKLLRGADSDWPRTQMQLIAAIGPPAISLLPQLLKLRDDESAELDPQSELDAAILAVQGLAVNPKGGS